jgi:hypothetical protein
MAEEQNLTPIIDSDMDSMFILPLSIIPLETPSLRRAKLIKNVRLVSAIELFADKSSGSGQMDIETLPRQFNWPQTPPHPDLMLLRKLALLPSYDVYSLRVLLREHGITVSQIDALKLSEEKSKELAGYMTKFTRPLMMQIYGTEQQQITDFDDLLKLFRDPDIKKAKEQLEIMAKKLNIGLLEVPKFLEDYGDIFLSLSYYRQCLDRLAPLLTTFIESIDIIRNNWQMRQDQNLLKTCQMVIETLNEKSAAITGRFENFDRSTKTMWDNLNAERFVKVKEMIENYHTTIGGVLCALTVKMNAFASMFPKKKSISPVKLGEFVMADMKQGIEKIQRIEDSAPMMSQLS